MVNGLPDRSEVVFDDERVVVNAGIVLAVAVGRRLGIEALVDAAVRLGGRPGASRFPLPATSPSRPPRPPRHRPLTALLSSTSFSSSRSTHFRLPPPRLRPSHHMPGLPCRFIWQVEEGGSSAKRWTPLPFRRDGDFTHYGGGGLITRSPHDFVVPRSGHWYIVAHTWGLRRSARISVAPMTAVRAMDPATPFNFDLASIARDAARYPGDDDAPPVAPRQRQLAASGSRLGTLAFRARRERQARALGYQGREDFYRRRYREQRARLDELAAELAGAESAVRGDLKRLRLGPDRARSHGARWQ